MRQNLFFESIDQAVCLISKNKADDKSSDNFLFEFNSAFKSIFPGIRDSNLFGEFSHAFETFVIESFNKKRKGSEVDFSIDYQQKTYRIFLTQLSSSQSVFLFKEEKMNPLAAGISNKELIEIGEYQGMNFSPDTFHDAPVMVIITDIHGKIEYVNKKFTEITGYTYKEAQGLNPHILKSGRQTLAFYKEMWETILGGKIWNNSFHNRKKSGQLYWQDTKMIPLTDESGKISRILALAEDVTESKAIKTIVEEKSDLLFQMVENNPDIVSVKDGEGRWLLANSADLKLFGLEGVSYYGKTGHELAEQATFYRTSMLNCIETDNVAWKTAKLSRVDEIIIKPDGNVIILDTLKIPIFNNDGSRKYLIVIGRDVTIHKKALDDLKQIEKRYALAQKAGGIVSWEWDVENLKLNWAENLEQVFESSDLFENKDFKSILEYIHPDDRRLFFRHMLKAVRNHEDYDFEIRIYDVHKNLKWVKLTGLVQFDEHKGKAFLLGIVYDITERKNYVKEIIEAKKKAVESDRLKSVFLATMSHELRTPLNAVIGFSDLVLGNQNLDSETDEFVRLINTNGLHLLSLIEDIFDLSLIESNQVTIYNAEFDLIQELQELTETIPVEIRKFEKENKIEFINELPDKQIILYNDAPRIMQIISNLLKNAIKFTPKGFVKLGVREKGEDVIIYVEDNGIGISKDKQKIIFEIFRQGEETLTRQFGGAGLGLSLSFNLSELMGGKLWVKSVEGKGSIFSFQIKRIPSGYKTISAKDLATQNIDWSDKYILIAEDEYSNFELLMYILKPTKVKIKHVTNGHDAIYEVLSVARPDLILMDIKMPDLNGFEATKQIKEVYPDLPIIAQTAFAIMGDRELALNMGCDDYISKPIKKPDLLSLLIKHLS